MERTATPGETAPPTPTCHPLPGKAGPDAAPDPSGPFLDAMPRQRATLAPVPGEVPADAARSRGPRPWRLLPTPTGTPFTFGYGVVLALTSVVTAYATPGTVHALHQGFSTDVAHLVRVPGLVLLGSALWIAGGFLSPFVAGFLLVLTALERRVGALRAAGVFLAGHVLATLATEGSVAIGVLAGRLPPSSLHRLDYGISFGVAACVGALAGLVTPWLRRPLLTVFGGMLLANLYSFTDPMTEWGHLIALAIGLATWPRLRRAARRRRTHRA
ncbi:rhomboid-like protein [Streptomyces mangrovisoli]|uniref:Uncharacterized protein n=1 Tax=Streptomyces mangrovisoli TaxID=1428628 RepID=A0A1J4NKH2_9ACTN|nr:rhomboid-like protein [Streptomyces mangrovisoli]OIJ62815.1 hypothetical protein WN71_037470 [Streptomyces mangrovisoli]